MNEIDLGKKEFLKEGDWELDFYSRPIIESNGKKRWELLISSTQELLQEEQFKWKKRCPAEEVNSRWLSTSLNEALGEAKRQGWEKPSRLRFFRPSMKTIIKNAADENGLEVISSRRTYSLIDWLIDREKNFYPNESGYINGPIAPPPSRLLNQPVPLPEAIRGDAWSIATLPIGVLQEASEWPIEFNGLTRIKASLDEKVPVPGVRIFSRSRSLALAAWLGGLEPVKLVLEKNQLLLEAGEDDRWLVTDLDKENTSFMKESLEKAKKDADGLQFISIQSTPEEEKFAGFWMLKDIDYF